jgi:hypothetical protein
MEMSRKMGMKELFCTIMQLHISCWWSKSAFSSTNATDGSEASTKFMGAFHHPKFSSFHD